MKQGQILNRVVMFLLLGAIIAYLGASAWRSLSDPLVTTLSYRYTVDDTVETTGFLVRTESVLPGQGLIADILPAEGEKVARGETVAYLYRDEAALERRNLLRTLNVQAQQMEHTLSWAAGGADGGGLSGEIVDKIVEVHASVARGALTNISEEAVELKNLVFQREYTYGGGDIQDIQTSIEALRAQMMALQTGASEDTAVVTAEEPGVFSGVADGYESVLTPESIQSLTPSSLRSVAFGVSADEGALGKLITDSRWYFVCTVSSEDSRRLVKGEQVKVRFSRDWSGEVSMRVERLSDVENGEVLAVLSSTRYLSETTLLRRQSVEIVFNSVTGIRVPKEAVRVESQTVTDPDSGREVQEDITCVYAMVGAQAERKPVTILAEGEDYFLVEAAPFRNPDSSSERKKALRPGDEIVVQADELYDGKVLRTG